jgi:uncharacterized membrane protein
VREPHLSTPSAESYRSALWVWPVLATVVALPAAVLLARVRPDEGSLLDSLWPGDPQSASIVLQVVATAVMTALTLTFSVTVVALQLASQQFSPRLLRDFTRDPVTKRVLAVLAGTFVFALTVARDMQGDEPLPTVALAASYLLGIASLVSIVAFIAHITRVIRVDTMMLSVHDETSDAIAAFYPPHDDDSPTGDQLGLDDAEGQLVVASGSGFVAATDVSRLVECAVAHDAVIRMEVRPGDHVVRHTPIATTWRLHGSTAVDGDELTEAVQAAMRFGYERTLEQDAGFGFRQLEDIAVKAVSPAINDPVTAAHAVGHMSDLLVRLVGRRLGPTLHLDDEGVGRVIVPDRDLRYYLELACGQLRRFGGSEPTVLIALLRMLRDVAASCLDEHQRGEVRRAADLVAGEVGPSVGEADRSAVEDLRARVDAALRDDLRTAFTDRVGETRSM